jgi:PEP-CTERM motif
VLTFDNARAGGWFATYAPVQNLQIVAVPEPATIVWLVLGLGFIRFRCKRNDVDT